MLKALPLSLALLGLLFLASWSAGAADDDEGKIPLSQVPAAARRAVEKAFPAAKFTEAYEDEDDDGQPVYELDGTNRQGRDIAVEVTPAGKILSVSTEIDLARVPRVVTTALRNKLKDFKPSYAMAVREEGEITGYYFEGKDGNGKDMNVNVTADGSEVEVEEGAEAAG